MRTFAAVIDSWPDPSPVTLADDIGEEAGTVRQWRSRNTLPPRVWVAIVAAAGRRGVAGISLECLARLAEKAAA